MNSVRRALCVLPALLLLTSEAQARDQLVRAEYGALNSWKDVTSRVRSYIRDGRLDFRVSNSALGGDPRPGEVKTLRMQFRRDNGSTYERECREDHQCTVSLEQGGGGGGNWGGGGGNWNNNSDLRIHRATYGYGSRTRDVTSRVASYANNGRIDIKVTNDTMGGDPASGDEKNLTVNYSYRGQRQTVTVREDDHLRIGGEGGNSGGSGGSSGGNWNQDLRIVRAVYGYGNRTRDVTSRVSSYVRDGRIDIKVTNDTMGGDPAKGDEKNLTVTYQYQGRRETATVREDHHLRIP